MYAEPRQNGEHSAMLAAVLTVGQFLLPAGALDAGRALLMASFIALAWYLSSTVIPDEIGRS